MSSLFAKPSLQFLTKHAVRSGKDAWQCKKTMQLIEFVAVEQKVKSAVPNKSKIRQVMYAVCKNPDCIVFPTPPPTGTSIEESDLAPLGLQ